MIELLRALCAPAGVSGDERAAAEAAAEILRPLGEVSFTPLGGVACRVSSAAADAPLVLLTAHLDEIGLMVIRVTRDGFLKAAPCGGADRRSLAGARVTVHTESGPVPGVVGSVPPHLADETNKGYPTAEDLWIDLGLSGEEAARLVSPGDRISFGGAFRRLLGDRVSMKALDNRAGCAAVIRAAQLLSGFCGARIAAALVTQEETGSAGAAADTFSLRPDRAYVVDVSMAQTPDDKPELCGKMGGGPMIGVSPWLSRALSRSLIETAERDGIPCQTEIMSGRTGTDADHIAPAAGGVPTALISIPLRYMHTPVEIVSAADVENTARLIAAHVRRDFSC